jgi:hypothetical protein
MMAMASDIAVSVKTGARLADSPTHRPAKMPAMTSTKPTPEHSSTFPGRQ